MEKYKIGDFIEHAALGAGKVIDADNKRNQTIKVSFVSGYRFNIMIADDMVGKIRRLSEEEYKQIGVSVPKAAVGSNSKYDPRIIGTSSDGNIAIKCNYCDGGRDIDHVGFLGVCSEKTIKYNIEDEHRAWCSNDKCPCLKYNKGKISRQELLNTMALHNDFVCYESTMLSDWMTQAGLDNDGKPRSFGYDIHEGAVCMLTTRLPDMSEKDRFIFAIFIIGDVFHGTNLKAGYVKADLYYRIELKPEEAKKIKYWNYHRNENNPDKEAWGTGLYRLLSNYSIFSLLLDLIAIRQGEKKQEVLAFLKEFCRRNSLSEPDIDDTNETESDNTDYMNQNNETDLLANKESLPIVDQKNDSELDEIRLENEIIEEDIDKLGLEGSDRVAVVKARVNQGIFRDLLIRKYQKCCLCGTDEDSLLVASHIKPWADSTHKERVDVNNGLLLCPNHDKLFDRGYISFDDSGNILISEKLSNSNKVYMNVTDDMSIPLSAESAVYMQYHRDLIFKK